MIKYNKGKMIFNGTPNVLRAEMTCLVNAFLSDKDMCKGDTRKERLEWFNKNVVERAYDSTRVEKGIEEAAQEIAKLLGKGADEILTGILKAMEAGMDDDDDDGEDEDE